MNPSGAILEIGFKGLSKVAFQTLWLCLCWETVLAQHTSSSGGSALRSGFPDPLCLLSKHSRFLLVRTSLSGSCSLRSPAARVSLIRDLLKRLLGGALVTWRTGAALPALARGGGEDHSGSPFDIFLSNSSRWPFGKGHNIAWPRR